MKALLYSMLFLNIGGYSQTNQSPLLRFSDIISGPSTGNTDESIDRGGAVVTVYGQHLGDEQSDSKIFIADIECKVYQWTKATHPADLYTYHKMQKISFIIPENVSLGKTHIYVVVNGVKSNNLNFSIRPGRIRFVSSEGDDDNGDGSYQKPWKTLDNLAHTGSMSKLLPGDILYVMSDLEHTELAGDRACIDIGDAGTQEYPKAIIAYPEAKVKIGNATVPRTFSLWVSGYGPSRHWVISGMHLEAKNEAVSMFDDFRVVGNKITAPEGNGPTGAVAGQGNDLYLLGNELTNIGNNSTSKLYHPIYIQSAESCSGPHLPTEKNRHIAFNYLHDNLSFDGINIYRECGSSAYMTDHHIHDNVLLNQTGCGIRVGDYVTGKNYVYNNVLIHCGLGPDAPNEYAMHVPLLIHAGWNDTISHVHCYNNTISGGGYLEGQEWSYAMVGFDYNRNFQLDFRNNVVNNTIDGIPYLNDRFDLPVGVYNNLWYGAGLAPSWDNLPSYGDPLFKSTHDLQLTSGSPAIDGSLPYMLHEKVLPVFDILGYQRDAYPDMGAYEYQLKLTTKNDMLPLRFTHIYPNPARDYLYYTTSGQDKGASVFSNLGFKIKTVESSPIYISDIKPGIYYIRFNGINRYASFVKY